MAHKNDTNRFMRSVKGSVRNVIRTSITDEPTSQARSEDSANLFVRRMQRVDGWLIHPHSRNALIWDTLVILLLGIQAIILPLQLAFLTDQMLVGYFCWIVWFNCWVDLVLWFDILLQFFLQVPSPDGSYWVRSLSNISWRYLTKEFVIDICGLFPFRYMVVQVMPMAPKAWLAVLPTIRGDRGDTARCGISLLCFHKMLRFSRIFRLHRTLQGRSILGSYSYRQSRLVKLFLTVVFTCHVMGCCWATLGVCGYGKHNWFHYVKSMKGDRDSLYGDDNYATIYMCSLYWAVFTLTGVGYGDIVPVSPIEYFMSNLFMLVAALVWAWVIATVVSLMATMNQASNEHLQTLDCINEVLNDTNVKVHFGRRLREYFTKIRDQKEHAFIGGVINQLSPDLKLEVVHAAHDVWLQKVWWLNKIPAYSQFIADMCLQMKATLHAPNELLPNKQELCIVLSGLCMHGGSLVTKGEIFGEDMLLNSEALRKPFATLAMTFLHLLVMGRPLLNSLVLKYPEAAVAIRRCYVQFSLIRGILYTADMRKRKEMQTGSTQSRSSSGFAAVDRGHLMKPKGDAEDVTGDVDEYYVDYHPSRSDDDVAPVNRRPSSRSKARHVTTWQVNRMASFSVAEPTRRKTSKSAAELLVSGYDEHEVFGDTSQGRGGMAYHITTNDVADLTKGARDLTSTLRERTSRLEANAHRLLELAENLKRL